MGVLLSWQTAVDRFAYTTPLLNINPPEPLEMDRIHRRGAEDGKVNLAMKTLPTLSLCGEDSA
jgi:hypothetical protein